jgi:hypothetical protein
MKISIWNLKKKLAISLEGIDKIWNEEIIYFIYATEIKTSNNTPIPPYTTYVYYPIPQVQVVVVYN